MNNVSRIPEATGEISVAANKYELIDSNGLECVIKPDGGDVYVTTRQKDNDFTGGYLVREGEEFTFCTRVYVYAKQACQVYFMKYRTL